MLRYNPLSFSELLLALLALLLTLVACWLWSRQKQLRYQLQLQSQQWQGMESELRQQNSSLQGKEQELQELCQRQFARLGALEASERALQEQKRELQQQLLQQQQRVADTDAQYHQLCRQHDVLATRHQQEVSALQEKQALLEASELRLGKEFESLAHKIFEQKSQAIRSSNESSLDLLLKPFKQQIESFQQQVQQKHEADTVRHSLLKQELDQLKQLNLRMSEEALNLTRALKGETKTQGNWGEVILQRLLDQAGLTEGREYQLQQALHNDKGQRLMPDVIVHLPQQKDIVIDSKVSLVAYERFVNASDEAQREQALQEHLGSIKNHIKSLSKKNYQNLEGIRTLDYVLLFIPIESAFLCAIQHDHALIPMAMDLNIMLVSPTNLMVALRTINNIWQVEQQNRNAQEIAGRAGKLYDKFVSFVDDLDRVDLALEKASRELRGAKQKLQLGSGNLIRQATQLQELGIRNTKQLSQDKTEQAQSD